MIADFLRRKGARIIMVAAPMVVALVCGAVGALVVEDLAFLKYVDRFIADWETAALLPHQPQDPDIVIVAINDETLQQFPYSTPVDRAFLSDVLETLASRSPRAIGLDILLSQPTEPEKDERLRRTLDTIKVPLVVSYADEEGIVNTAQREFLDDFVPERLRGLSALGADQFDTVRWIYPGHVGRNGRWIPSFDRALAASVGVQTPAEMTDIVWHGLPGNGVPPFRVFPAHVVAALPGAWLKDKVILVGTTADRHRTAFATIFERGEGMLPAVEIHADGVAQLLHHTPLPALTPKTSLSIAIIASSLGAILGLVGWPLWLRLVAGTMLLAAIWIGGGALFHFVGLMPGLVAPTLALTAAFFATEALSGREARRQREFITGAFSSYVSHKVVEALIKDPSRMTLEGERRVMTFLFTDIANFTTMSEMLDPGELARVLNGYFDGLLEIVLKYDGTIGRFEGDAAFVIFNAPVDQHDHHERAVRCALEIDQFAAAYCTEQNLGGVPFGTTRIGIHTGSAVVGNFGSRRRFDYSAQGDAVNTAARLEGVNKQFGTHICVSEATHALCHGIAFRPLGSVVVKGKSTGIRVWEPRSAESAYLARYREAYAKLEGEAPEALGLFAALNQENPDDRCVALHLERLYRGERGAELVLTEK